LQTCTYLPEEELAIVSLRLSFGGRPCPQECVVLAEPICDLTNMILKSNDWDPKDLFSPYQHLVPEKQPHHENVPFGEAKELAVDIPVDPRGQAVVYIDDIIAQSVDLSGTNNTNHLVRALLAIHATARPRHDKEPIPREEMPALTKLAAEVGLEETKTILGWLLISDASSYPCQRTNS
jgi:hypothetical protein